MRQELYKAGVKKKMVRIFVALSLVFYSTIIYILRVHSTYAENKVLARVDGYKITPEDFKREIEIYERFGSVRDKLMALTPRGRRAILKNMIQETLFYKGARDEGIKLDEVTEAYIERLRRIFMMREYIKAKLAEKPITEEEEKRYYTHHESEFIIPETRKIRHIVVKDKALAQKLLKRVKSGEDFSKLASTYNIDGTRSTGGNLGWVKRGVMVKEFEDIAFKLKKGEISGVIKTRFGYHIIKVENIREREIVSYERAKKEIRKKLLQIRIEDIEKELYKRYGVTTNEKLIEEINKNMVVK